MKNLIVYAHPNEDSFNHAMVKKIEQKLKERGEEVFIRDLYKLNFNPVLTLSEMNDLREGKVSDDIKVEQDLIKQCENIIFIYPIWWVSMPAILKGYVDRVLSYGFAYQFNDQGGIDALLKGKNVMIFNTQGTPSEYYDANGMTEALNKTSDVGIFGFCGMNVSKHLYLGKIPYIEYSTGEEILEKIISDI